MQTEQNPFFLFLGNCDREGAVSKLKAAGWEYKRKMLESRLENWESIFSLLATDNMSGVIVKLNNTTYNLMARPEYSKATKKLFKTLQNVPHIIFIHESLYTGISVDDSVVEENDYYYDVFCLPKQEIIEQINDLIEQHDLNVVLYKKNAELSVIASEFIDQNEKNLIFRLYVPSGRMWAVEADKLLQLFRDYLSKISGLRVSQDQYSTKQGVIYEFFGDHTVNPSTLPKEFDDFSKLLDMCVVNPTEATRMLVGRSVDARIVDEIIERYSKEAKRLHVDLKHERERRLLSIRHRLESELVDVCGEQIDWDEVNIIVDASVPQLGGVSSAIGFGSTSQNNIGTANVTINIKPQIIASVQGIVAQEVSGTTNFGVEAAQVIELIKQYGGTHVTELTSAVYELEDTDAKQAERLSAKQKLKTFLFKASDKIGDIALGVLQRYIESKLGL